MRRFLTVLLLAASPLAIFAQSEEGYDDFRAEMMKRFNSSRNEMHKDYEDFRSKAMKKYIDFVRNAWNTFEGNEPEPAPEEPPVPPVTIPDEEKVLPIDDEPVKISVVIEPVKVEPQPQPYQPIEPLPVKVEKRVKFSFFGTPVAVRFDLKDRVALRALDENAIADALERMSAPSHDNMIVDCLELRERLCLSDWAYINMLDALSKEIYGSDANSATLLMAYLYMSSGYKMRLAKDGSRLYMLYASRHYVYEQPFFLIDEVRYYGMETLPHSLNICDAAFDNEAPLSLIVAGAQQLAFAPAQKHAFAAVDYPGFGVEVTVNKNMLDFYSTVPTSMIGENMYTRWAMYANTPMDPGVAAELYPAIESAIEGMSEVEAVNRILNLVQTGFEYKRDDEVWGGDRVFFPDEALFYSVNDCDDRSVLFSRLVRDILGLDAVLVFVPGHVLVGVEFKGDVKGGYVTVGNRKFTLCEPTCINGAPVGWNDIKEGVSVNLYLLER